ncbi:hypothetical protein MTsPCn5_19190 [Croceitalea sp. MTPC5]|uniref:response regulator n=1 Tax=Croceitalea sp. MTPC5 TaxID=3056565 RepID=UPI002B3A7B92|nr:hypothetical protein MTsPCn5_19190 [Croceitalea sp. MTPC5]
MVSTLTPPPGIKPFQVLIVEDVPIICQYYQGMFVTLRHEGAPFSVTVAPTFDKAVAAMDRALATGSSFDLVLLDIRLRDTEKQKTEDGEALGKQLRQKMPETKILVVTAHDNNFRYHTILRHIRPEGFMLKYELNDTEFAKAITSLMANKNYYGASITKYMNAQMGLAGTLDDIDRKLLFLLSNCLTTKEISKMLPLSPSGIEKRKRNLSAFFGLENAKTVSLIQAAKAHGYLD